VIKVTQLYCRSFDLDHLDLFWAVEDFEGSSVDIRQFDIYILRSEAMFGPYEIIGGPFKDIYQFRDVSPALMHKWRELYYKIRIVDTATQETEEFGPTAQEGEPDLIALEIHRQEDVLFREFVGRRCWLFPVRTFGPKCTCYDKVAGRRTRSNHMPCFDTGYLGGFLSPVECFIQFDPAANNPSQTPMMEQQNTNTSIRLLSFPPVKPKDILVEAENKRWRVVTVTTTQRLRAVVHQEVTVHEIPRGDIEFKLPINIADLRSLSPAAERNYTNPQHTDGYSGNDLLALYGQPRGSVR
jgi:hypothetical protein